MKSFVILCLVLSLVVGKSTATEEYLGNCYVGCLLGSCLQGAVQCTMCIAKCLIKTDSSSVELNPMDNRYFCKLGCSTSLCAKLLTNKRPDHKMVKGCVGSCSQRCTNTMN